MTESSCEVLNLSRLARNGKPNGCVFCSPFGLPFKAAKKPFECLTRIDISFRSKRVPSSLKCQTGSLIPTHKQCHKHRCAFRENRWPWWINHQVNQGYLFFLPKQLQRTPMSLMPKQPQGQEGLSDVIASVAADAATGHKEPKHLPREPLMPIICWLSGQKACYKTHVSAIVASPLFYFVCSFRGAEGETLVFHEQLYLDAWFQPRWNQTVHQNAPVGLGGVTFGGSKPIRGCINPASGSNANHTPPTLAVDD